MGGWTSLPARSAVYKWLRALRARVRLQASRFGAALPIRTAKERVISDFAPSDE